MKGAEDSAELSDARRGQKRSDSQTGTELPYTRFPRFHSAVIEGRLAFNLFQLAFEVACDLVSQMPGKQTRGESK